MIRALALLLLLAAPGCYDTPTSTADCDHAMFNAERAFSQVEYQMGYALALAEQGAPIRNAGHLQAARENYEAAYQNSVSVCAKAGIK